MPILPSIQSNVRRQMRSVPVCKNTGGGGGGGGAPGRVVLPRLYISFARQIRSLLKEYGNDGVHLFELIARMFLAACGGAAQGQGTRACEVSRGFAPLPRSLSLSPSLNVFLAVVTVRVGPETFTAAGLVVLERNYLDVRLRLCSGPAGNRLASAANRYEQRGVHN